MQGWMGEVVMGEGGGAGGVNPHPPTCIKYLRDLILFLKYYVNTE